MKITLARHDKRTWLVQHDNTITRIPAPHNTPRRDRINVMRKLISEATHIPTQQLRFLGNVRIGDVWCTQWCDVNDLN